jgi:hypothetical protein
MINNPTQIKETSSKQSLGESEVSNNQQQVDGIEATSVSLAEKSDDSSLSNSQEVRTSNTSQELNSSQEHGFMLEPDSLQGREEQLLKDIKRLNDEITATGCIDPDEADRLQMYEEELKDIMIKGILVKKRRQELFADRGNFNINNESFRGREKELKRLIDERQRCIRKLMEQINIEDEMKIAGEITKDLWWTQYVYELKGIQEERARILSSQAIKDFDDYVDCIRGDWSDFDGRELSKVWYKTKEKIIIKT